MAQIHRFAERGDKEGVLRELTSGVSANLREGQYGYSPLLLAASSSKADVSLLELLISYGADVNAVFDHGWTPLNMAFYSVDKVRCLLQHGAKFDLGPSEERAFPSSCSLETSELLLQMGLESTTELASNVFFAEGGLKIDELLLYEKYGYGRKKLSWNKLMCAIVFGTTEDLTSFDIRTEDLEFKDSWERSPMLLSIRTGNVEKAKLLLERGGSLSDKWRCGNGAIDCAIESSSSDMLLWLISMDVDIHSHVFGGDTPLITAASYGNSDAVQILLENKVDVAASNEVDEQAINCANNAKSIRLLAAAGADLNHIDGLGRFPLMNAVEEGNVESVRALIELGADVNNHNLGYTALHKAASCDELESMEVLLAAGADPNAAEDDAHWRPLWRAKSREAVRVLLENGADLSLRDDMGFPVYSFHRGADFRDLLRS